MENAFALEIASPFRHLPQVRASEVVLPAIDGEVGVLPGHENLVGLLGTGPLKYVSNGNDYWFVVSTGSYQVLDGKLTVLAEVVEDAKEIDLESAKQSAARLESELSGADMTTPDALKKLEDLNRNRARIEVFRRVNQLN